MFDTFGARDGPALMDHALGLLSGLQRLRLRFQDAVARLVGGSVAGAVSGLLRHLLGWHQTGEEPYPNALSGRSPGWGEVSHHFEDQHEGLLGSWPTPLVPTGWLSQWVTALMGWLLSLTI